MIQGAHAAARVIPSCLRVVNRLPHCTTAREMNTTLPILERRKEIEQAIARHQVVIVCGEAGSGKTTQLPQICLGLGRGGRAMIGHTQPRRLAARSVAARIAEEMGVQLGGKVGVKVRFHDQTSRATAIKLLTDGMLLAELTGDADLRAYDTIIIDEAHERSLNIDFLLGYLRRLLPRRPDLKVIVTSATIDPGRFSTYFGGAPVIEVSGRMFPVEMRYRPTGADEEEFERLEVEAVADAVDELTSTRLPAEGGDVLVFLPGEREIRLAADAVRRRFTGASAAGIEVLPLFSRLSNQEQDRIFHPGGSRRRVILSTNVAETSLTVPGIRYVVDTGLARIARYDPQRRIGRLPIEPVSQASAKQRAGRCGRVAEGVCIRLYSEESLRRQPVFTDPEIRRTSLASVILQMRALRLGPVEEFPFLDAPDAAAVKDGYETLFELGAIDAPTSAGCITEIGARLARLPLDPRIGRMLLASEREGVLREVTVLAAALSIQDPRERPMGRQEDSDRAQLVFRNERSDFLTLLNLWEQYEHASGDLASGPLMGWCRERFVSGARMREWGELIRQLGEVMEEDDRGGDSPAAPPPSAKGGEDAVHRALLTGLISNVACRDGDAQSFMYRGVRGNEVAIFPGSALFKKAPKWIMAAEIVQTTRLYARTVAKIEPAWIEELAGHVFSRQVGDRHIDAETGEPSAFERVTMSGVVVVPRRRVALATIDPAGARALLLREGIAEGRWKSDAPALARVREVLAEARRAEAKLRRRDVLADADQIAAALDARVPREVCDPESFLRWAGPAGNNALGLSLADVLRPGARAALDDSAYPDAIIIGAGHDAVSLPLDYALAPGKEEDGITVTVELASLPRLTPERAAWLVPGLLPELVQALIKGLPKAQRAALESRGTIPKTAAECAGVMEFGRGTLSGALSEAMEVLHGVRVEPGAWSFKGLPLHLVLRVRVVDHAGKEIALDRDLTGLHARLAGRVRKAQAAGARSRFEREGLREWSFGDLPGTVPIERGDEVVLMHPALVDRGDSAALTLMTSESQAAEATQRGVRRLLAIGAGEELGHHLTALGNWHEMARQYSALGTEAQFRGEMACLIVERTFMAGQPPIRTQAEFMDRQQAHWGRLGAATRETAEIVSRILEPRAKVAHRLSGGTPRLWAASIADLREHAAYLMPRGFLLDVPAERLRQYPRYAEAMRARLMALREDGSGAETAALAAIAPHWKRYTGHVAAAMSAERASAAEGGDDAPEQGPGRPGGAHSPPGKAPLPQARRAAPKVNLDAGEWAMHPGNLGAAMQAYRWALEDLRVALFAPELAGKPAMTVEQVQALWARAQEGGTKRA